MEPRERWLAVLNHEKPDRVPMDYRATGEATQKLLKHMGLDNLSQAFEKLHIDSVVDVGPKYTGPPIPPDKDVYGIGYEDTDYGTGHYRNAVHHPLAGFKSVEEIEDNYRWPSFDWYDYSRIPDQIKGKEHQVIRGGGSEPFATYKWLRGVEQGYMDLYENPEMVHYCLDKLYDMCYEKTRRCYEAIPGKIIWTWVAEDLGTQESLLCSLAHIEEFFLPRMKRMTDIVHEGGGYAFHHSDGAVRANIPNMIEKVGIDVLDPVQWRCKGMEREGLARDFGDRLVFHGAMDNQFTLPKGSVKDVRKEVEDNIRILGANNGYILGPCHNIQVVSPPENVVAMYEAGYECGRMR
ncbi:MAG: uroporphyrinogen decarboxylase family protein [Planctomycetota bacterium]